MAPTFTLRSQEDDQWVFRADGRDMPIPYGNALRRFLYARLPMVAIDTQSVKLAAEEGFENGTSDDDELLRRQIGWIPLIVPLGQEEGLLFRIADPEDPMRPFVNRSIASMLVTCAHVQVERHGEPVPPETVFAHMGFPITSLGNGESLRCEFKAVAGTATENPLGRRATEFQPLCAVGVRFELDAARETAGFRIPDEQEYVKLDAHAPAGLVWTVELSTVPSTYTCGEAVEKGLALLVREVETLRRAWADRNESYVRVEEETDHALTAYWMNTDGYSIFGMLQHAFNEVVQREGLDGNTHFCGFRETHPQEKQMQVTVLVSPSSSFRASQLFVRAFDWMHERCTSLLTAWRRDMM